MKLIINSFIDKLSLVIFRLWNKSTGFVIGFGALAWFLIRVIPKPSRATYPCQQAAFPIASAFVVWLTATFSSMFFFKKLAKTFAHHRLVVSICSVASMVALIGWLTVMPLGIVKTFGSTPTDPAVFIPAVGYDW